MRNLIFMILSLDNRPHAITVSAIYNSCAIKVTTLKGKIGFIPVDHVGETAQTNGLKSFSLTIISDINGKRQLKFID